MAQTIALIVSAIVPLILGLISFGVLSYTMPTLPTTGDPRILQQADVVLTMFNDSVSYVILGLGMVATAISICIGTLALKTVSFI